MFLILKKDCESAFHHYDKMHELINLKEEKGFRLSSVDSVAFGYVAIQNVMAGTMCWSKAVYLVVARKQTERKRMSKNSKSLFKVMPR
jgi:hypothetical protein